MKLFEKEFIGTLELNNRVIMSPMNVGGNNIILWIRCTSL